MTSSCHEAGIAVSMTVRTELGIAATSEEAEAAAAASASGSVRLPLAVCCGSGEASAEATKRRAAKDVRMVIAWAGFNRGRA